MDDENNSGSGCGVVETKLEEMNLECTNNIKDGMGEIRSIIYLLIDEYCGVFNESFCSSIPYIDRNDSVPQGSSYFINT